MTPVEAVSVSRYTLTQPDIQLFNQTVFYPMTQHSLANFVINFCGTLRLPYSPNMLIYTLRPSVLLSYCSQDISDFDTGVEHTVGGSV